ncbi:MAG TPA: M56 family metallopeptidase [Pyrinomonadaceae bacterium]|nr:M56 family metallopeptidase [Pyrinomonadaceae bacterium]
MNMEIFTGSKLAMDLGWTLIHSLWQIALVAACLLLALRVLRDSSPQVRYLASVSALGISLILPVLTFIQTATQPASGNSFAAARVQDFQRPELEQFKSVDAGDVNATTAGTSNDQSSRGFIAGATAVLERYISDFAPLIAGLWLLGVAFFSVRLGGGFSQLRRFRTKSATDVDPGWQKEFSRICSLVGGTHTVRILQSTLVETPIAIGVFKPVVLVPAALFFQIHPRELETIIAHELIHIRRYDPLVNVVQCMIETVLFYHPATWWISSQVRREREFAADAAVLEIFEDSHVTYARALANLEEIRLRTNQQMPRYATAANGGNFMQRIQRILKIKTEVSRANSAWTAGLAFFLTSAFLLAIFSFTSSDLVNAQSRTGSKKLAVGFVGIPPVDRSANPPKDSDATTRLLIQELKEHKVPATGFLTGNMVSDGEKLFPVRANMARMWRDAGFEVGLGGFKHVWLYHTPVDEYIANIEKNEAVAKQVLGDGTTLRHFSYPFLNTGKSAEDKARVESWLASHGLSSVKYTFDNSEWMYSWAYDMARNDNDVNTMKEIREAYLAYMSKMFDHYEAYSTEMFGRDIPQTLVLTSSRLVTDTADDFFGMAIKRGYSFVTIDEAQSDEAYRTKENFVGDAGISWFERWAMAKGTKLRAEPEVDTGVQKLWKDKQVAAKK